jgi:hypothetical protein
MEDEREKEKNERALQEEEDSGDEEGTMNGEDKAKMDEMLKTLNDRLDAGGNGAAAAASSKKAKKRANKRKKSPRGGKQKQQLLQHEDDGKRTTENEEEKHLAEKLRQKIAESLGQVRATQISSGLQFHTHFAPARSNVSARLLFV